jgi:hypothetical protein
MEPEERAFIAYWVRESRREQMSEIGKLLGVFFSVGEIRKWGGPDTGNHTYRDDENILIPLSIVLKPELREGLKKMVGGLALPDGYKKGAQEVMVDLGGVSPDDFMYFAKHGRLPDATSLGSSQRG